jgi:hypothetical protein
MHDARAFIDQGGNILKFDKPVFVPDDSNFDAQVFKPGPGQKARRKLDIDHHHVIPTAPIETVSQVIDSFRGIRKKGDFFGFDRKQPRTLSSRKLDHVGFQAARFLTT